jgi:hypothetical protein
LPGRMITTILSEEFAAPVVPTILAKE